MEILDLCLVGRIRSFHYTSVLTRLNNVVFKCFGTKMLGPKGLQEPPMGASMHGNIHPDDVGL